MGERKHPTKMTSTAAADTNDNVLSDSNGSPVLSADGETKLAEQLAQNSTASAVGRSVQRDLTADLLESSKSQLEKQVSSTQVQEAAQDDVDSSKHTPLSPQAVSGSTKPLPTSPTNGAKPEHSNAEQNVRDTTQKDTSDPLLATDSKQVLSEVDVVNPPITPRKYVTIMDAAIEDSEE